VVAAAAVADSVVAGATAVAVAVEATGAAGNPRAKPTNERGCRFATAAPFSFP